MDKNIIIIVVVIIIIIMVGGISYFYYKKYLKDNETPVNSKCGNISQSNSINKLINNASQIQESSQVYNIRDNIYTYKDARAVCKAHGGRLASLDQVIEAYHKGADWCNYGWSEGQLALFPTQKKSWEKLQGDSKRRTECGVPGVNGGYFRDKKYLFGANCYGPKPEAKPHEKYKNNYNVDPLDNRISYYKKQLDTTKILPFNSNKWSQYE